MNILAFAVLENPGLPEEGETERWIGSKTVGC